MNSNSGLARESTAACTVEKHFASLPSSCQDPPANCTQDLSVVKQLVANQVFARGLADRTGKRRLSVEAAVQSTFWLGRRNKLQVHIVQVGHVQLAVTATFGYTLGDCFCMNLV